MSQNLSDSDRVLTAASVPAMVLDEDSLRDRLKHFLEKKHLKFSEPRWKMVRAILSAKRHMTAQEMVRAVRTRFPGIGAATVYRNLKLLCDAHILRETALNSEGRAVYEAYSDEHHDHVVCVDCGRVFEFHSELIEREQTRIVEGLGLVAVNHRHVIYGRCKDQNTVGEKTICHHSLDG